MTAADRERTLEGHATSPHQERFAVPDLPQLLVDRPRLLQRLDATLDRRLTSLTGPAGYGKSVAAALWCHTRTSLPTMWLELDRADMNPATMVRRILEAARAVTGRAIPFDDSQLVSTPIRLGRAIVDRLSDALADSPECVLVIDGLRASGPVGVYADVALAMETSHNCGIHLLSLSRCIPPYELTPLRLRGAFTQLDVADLRLDAEEMAAVVGAYSGKRIDAAAATALTESLEGWMAGAVLVGLSHPSATGVSADDLLNAASGAIDGYLAAEVVDRVPEHIRSFLVDTACVDELSGPLCDRLTGRDDSADVLTSLQVYGLPIWGGRTGRGSMRLHGLLRSALDARARRQDPTRREQLTRTAVDWYNEQQMPFEAAEACIRLGDWNEAGNVIVLNLQRILERDEIARLAKLLPRIPPSLLREKLQLVLSGAWVLLMGGRIAAMYDLLMVYERWMVPRMRMIADVLRSTAVSWVSDPLVPLASAESAIAACEELGDDHEFGVTWGPSTTDFYRSSARANVLLSCCYAGLWERGRPHLVPLSPHTAAHLPQIQQIRIYGKRATFLALAGEVASGLDEARVGLTIATEADMREHRIAADTFYAFGEASRLAGAFDDAHRALEHAADLAVVNGRTNLIAAATASRAQLYTDTGRPVDALAVLASHRDGGQRRGPRTVDGMLAAAEARALAALGDHHKALGVLASVTPTSTTSAVRVAAAVAAGNLAHARETLERWPAEATVASAVRHHLAAAITHDASGGTRTALASLRSALSAAAPHGLVQPFTEIGPIVGRLLRRVNLRAREAAMASIVAAVGQRMETDAAAAPRFTQREEAVLAQLDRGLSLPKVAQEMFVSVNTVKTHVKAIYRKLGASTRAEALAAWRASQRPDRAD